MLRVQGALPVAACSLDVITSGRHRRSASIMLYCRPAASVVFDIPNDAFPGKYFVPGSVLCAVSQGLNSKCRSPV
jgi:hypothetical protein